MSVDQALEQFKMYAQDFASIENVKEYIKLNRDEFLKKFAKIKQYYNYIKSNCKGTEWADLYDITISIKKSNPSLEKFVDLITRPQLQQSQSKQPVQKVSFDTSGLTSTINTLVSKINNMQVFDPDEIDDIDWKLRKSQERLKANQNAFSPNEYQMLLNDVNATLNRINSFRNVVNSDTIIKMP